MPAPAPSPDYLTRSYDFDSPEIVAVFDDVTVWSARFGLLYLDHLALRPGQTILDVGCGPGFPLLELAELHGTSCRLIGLDVWWPALRRAEVKRQRREIPQAALLHGDGLRLPLAAGSVDLVVSNVGVNNFPDVEQALAECGRVTRQGGRIALTTNLQGHMAEFYAVFREVLATFDRPDYLARLDVHEATRTTPERLTGELAAAGYTVTRQERGAFTLRYVDGSAFLRQWLTVTAFLPAWRALLAPADEAAAFAALEAKLNARAAQGGELRLTVPTLYIEAVRA